VTHARLYDEDCTNQHRNLYLFNTFSSNGDFLWHSVKDASDMRVPAENFGTAVVDNMLVFGNDGQGAYCICGITIEPDSKYVDVTGDQGSKSHTIGGLTFDPVARVLFAFGYYGKVETRNGYSVWSLEGNLIHRQAAANEDDFGWSGRHFYRVGSDGAIYCLSPKSILVY